MRHVCLLGTQLSKANTSIYLVLWLSGSFVGLLIWNASVCWEYSWAKGTPPSTSFTGCRLFATAAFQGQAAKVFNTKRKCYLKATQNHCSEIRHLLWCAKGAGQERDRGLETIDLHYSECLVGRLCLCCIIYVICSALFNKKVFPFESDCVHRRLIFYSTGSVIQY